MILNSIAFRGFQPRNALPSQSMAVNSESHAKRETSRTGNELQTGIRFEKQIVDL